MSNTIKIRIIIIFFALISLYAIVIGNLYIIQIKQSSFFNAIAQQQYHVIMTLRPPRAEIYDRNKQPMAMNKDSLAAFTVPNALAEPEKIKNFLQRHFPLAYERLLKNSDAPFMYVQRRLTPEQKELIEKAALPDMQFLKEPSRFYPIESAGPLTGITDSDNQGLFGIELMYNTQLAGTPTTYSLEKDARSGQFYFKKETKVQGHEGGPIHLTIDGDLQFLAYEELADCVQKFGSTEGSVLVMNPDNGDILVMANYPHFDPNNTKQIDLEKTKNKIITEVYEFGSVMKVFTALAALEEKVVTPDEIIDCENKKSSYVNGIRVNTWKEHGLLTFAEVIELSNNIGTAKVALRLGPKLYDHYIRCGFGKKTDIPFPGEQKGFVNHPSNWSKPSIISLSFGYEINATLLQLGCAFCMIANNGIPVQPRLLLEAEPHHTGRPSKSLYSPETMQTIRDILEKTTTEGTAHKAHIKGYTVMGKTGTANLLINGKYTPDHNIFTFAGIIEKGDYKRVIVTFIKEAQKKNIYASSVAVPLFEAVAQKMLIHDKILS